MKTGVVTFHSAHNYGATLQAWALQKAIKKLGVTPCIVNYHPEVIDRLYTVPRLDTWAKRMGGDRTCPGTGDAGCGAGEQRVLQ